MQLDKSKAHSNCNSRFKASPMAEEMAEANRNIAITSDFIFLGAFVNAYSRPVIDARISENAMRT